MARLITLLSVALFAASPTAFADDAARRAIDAAYASIHTSAGEALWRAETLMDQTHAAASPAALDAVTTGFVRATAEASATLNQHDGPADLVCIFAGMAEDADNALARFSAASSADERLAALGHLRALFDDAVVITPRSEHTEAGPSGPASAMSCPVAASALAVDDQLYLTVQP